MIGRGDENEFVRQIDAHGDVFQVAPRSGLPLDHPRRRPRPKRPEPVPVVKPGRCRRRPTSKRQGPRAIPKGCSTARAAGGEDSDATTVKPVPFRTVGSGSSLILATFLIPFLASVAGEARCRCGNVGSPWRLFLSLIILCPGEKNRKIVLGRRPPSKFDGRQRKPTRGGYYATNARVFQGGTDSWLSVPPIKDQFSVARWRVPLASPVPGITLRSGKPPGGTGSTSVLRSGKPPGR